MSEFYTVRNKLIDREFYQSILEVLNDKSRNKQIKAFADEVRFSKALNYKCSRAYALYIVLLNAFRDKKMLKELSKHLKIVDQKVSS